MDKLKELMSLCKASVTLEVNDHKNDYQSVERYLEDIREFMNDVEDDVRDEMIARDTIIDLHFYPNTPVGFYKILHYDLDIALDIAIKTIKGDRGCE